jgi:hypothetical protein
MEENKELHAFYSAEADKLYGHAIYSFCSPISKERETVKVTGVYSSKEEGEQSYKWKDKVYLGIVNKWVFNHD